MLDDLLKLCFTIRDKQKNYAKWADPIFDKDKTPFGMIFNQATLTFELLNFYYEVWKIPHSSTPSDIDETKEENGERIIVITRWCFIGSISAIEHCTKEIIKNTSKPEFQEIKNMILKGDRIYLSTIMKQSYDAKLIDENDYTQWDALIFLRNSAVHNNSISDKNETLKIGDVEFLCTKGAMLKGKLDTLLKLTDISSDLYFKWLHIF